MEIKKKLIQILFSGLALTLFSCSNPKDNVFKQADYGDDWPFTVAEVEVFCDGYNRVYAKSGGRIYALNGSAIGPVKTGKSEVTNRVVDEIWRDNPKIEGTKIRIPSEFIQKGLSMCENNQ